MPPQAQLPDARACRRFYDERYARGYMDDWPAHKLERVREIIAALRLPETGTALDFGCGNGVFTAVLRDGLPGWRIIGLDVSRVAVENARRMVAGCEFYQVDDHAGPDEPREAPLHTATEAAIEPGSVHFLFTHHVLEHVRDLGLTWAQMAGFMRKHSRMLHVLPCGNPGSFEHELCRMRVDGMNPDAGGRFVYEDPGHLRRLQTCDMIALADRFGYRLVQEHYSHHQVEALDWLSGNGMRFVLDLCDPAKAVDVAARRCLVSIRRRLVWMASVKSVARRRTLWMRPLARLAHAWSNRWALAGEREWRQMRSRPDGSEMYLAFHRDRGVHT